MNKDQRTRYDRLATFISKIASRQHLNYPKLGVYNSIIRSHILRGDGSVRLMTLARWAEARGINLPLDRDQDWWDKLVSQDSPNE